MCLTGVGPIQSRVGHVDARSGHMTAPSEVLWRAGGGANEPHWEYLGQLGAGHMWVTCPTGVGLFPARYGTS